MRIKGQSGFSAIKLVVIGAVVLVAVVVVLIVSNTLSTTESSNKVEQELSSLVLPVGVTLQGSSCHAGDAVDQGTSQCTFTYSASDTHAGFNGMKQSLQTLGITGTDTVGTYYFHGGNPGLNGQLNENKSTNQLVIEASLGN
jgi:hypothetical protein